MRSSHSANKAVIFNISATQQLMLEACLATTKEARAAAVLAWEAQVVMDELEFSSSRLMPYFYHRNQQDGICTRYDNRIKTIYKHWWLRTQHISHQLKVVVSALAEAGIQVVVIKGASLKMHYEQDVLRPMADFDLLVGREDIVKALQVIESLHYGPDTLAKSFLQNYPGLFLDFKHAISCKHQQNATEIDLHWQVGARSSKHFIAHLWLHLEDYPGIAAAKKPPLAYEVFMLIIHAVDNGSKDNLNWIIDIAMMNEKAGTGFWKAAREIALAEKKEDLFDYGCAILQSLGVYAYDPGKVKRPKTLINTSERQLAQIGSIRLLLYKVHNLFIIVKRLYPHANACVRTYQLVRCAYLYFIARRIHAKPVFDTVSV